MAKNLDRFLFDGRKISFLDEFILLLTLPFFKMMSLMKDDRTKKKNRFFRTIHLNALDQQYLFSIRKHFEKSKSNISSAMPDFTASVVKSVYLVSVATLLKGVYLKNSSQKLAAISHTKFFFFTEKSKNRTEKKLGGHFGQRN